MNCRSAVRLLERYRDGDLPEAERDRAKEHLRTCSACAQEWEALQRLEVLLDGVPELEPPSTFTTDVLRALAAETSQAPVSAPSALGWAFGLAGVLLTAAIVAGLSGVGPLDFGAWHLAVGSVATSVARLAVLGAEVGRPVGEALLTGLARPMAWMLAVDLGLLTLVLLGARHLRAGRLSRRLNSLVTL